MDRNSIPHRGDNIHIWFIKWKAGAEDYLIKDRLARLPRAIIQAVEKRKTLSEKKQTEQMLIQSEKMATIGILAAGIAHEINNPIGYIRSNLSYLEKCKIKLLQYFLDEDKIIEKWSKQNRTIKQEIDNLRAEGELDFMIDDFGAAISESIDGIQKVAKIISELKGFSRMEKPDLKLENLHNCIEKTLRIVSNEIKYKAEVIKEFDEIPRVECDAQKMNQVFLNLIVNASQAIKNRGVITISTKYLNNSVIIKISDNGSGIPQEKIGKIFDAFYTTKEEYEGTGLGLSIVFKIIQEHNGSIEVDSQLGSGTMFTIRLPVKQKLNE